MFDILNKNNSNHIHINEMDKLIGKVELIDIREPLEYNSGTLKTAKNIPMDNLLINPTKYLTKDKTYYIMCHSGARSEVTTRELTKQGYHVINLDGGISSYNGFNRI